MPSHDLNVNGRSGDHHGVSNDQSASRAKRKAVVLNMDKTHPCTCFRFMIERVAVFVTTRKITIFPARDPWPEAMPRRRNLSPICPRAEAWEDCRLNLPSLHENTRLGGSRGKAAGSLASSAPGSSEEGRKEYLRHRESAVLLLR